MRLVRILVPVVVLGLTASTVAARTNDATTAPAPASSPLDMPIETIADSTGGCAVLDKDFPGLRDHPMYPFFKAMTLNQIAAMSKGQITPDMLAQAKADLTTLSAAPVTMASSDAPAAADMAEDPAPAPLVAMTVAAPLAPTPVSATVAAMH